MLLASGAVAAAPPVMELKDFVLDLKAALQELEKGGVAPFHKPAYVSEWQDRIARYRSTIAAYGDSEGPLYRVAVASLLEFEGRVAFAITESAKQKVDMRNLHNQLRRIEALLVEHSVPARLEVPFSEDDARKWVADCNATREASQKALSELAQIEAKAGPRLIGVAAVAGEALEPDDIGRLESLASANIESVEHALIDTIDQLKKRFDRQGRELELLRKKDARNATIAKEAQPDLQRHLDLVNSIQAYQQAFDKAPSLAILERLAEIEYLRDKFKNGTDRPSR